MNKHVKEKKISARYPCDVWVNSVRQGLPVPLEKTIAKGSRVFAKSKIESIDSPVQSSTVPQKKRFTYVDLNRLHPWLYENKLLTTTDPRIYQNLDSEIINGQFECVTTDLNTLMSCIRLKYLKNKNNKFFEKHGLEKKSFEVELEKQLKVLQEKIPNLQFWFPKDNFFLDVVTFVQSELLVLEDFFPLTSHGSLDSFRNNSQWSLLENSFKVLTRENFVSSVKYHTAYLMAKALENEPPKRPSDFIIGSPLIWSGPIKTAIKNILNRKGKRAFQLGFTFLQGIKRGCQMVPEIYLKKAIVDHAVQMNTPPSKSFEEVYNYFGDSLGNLPHRGKVKPFRFDEVYEPSHSSCFEATKGDGGQYGEVITQLKLEKAPVYVLTEGRIKVNETFKTPDDFHKVIMDRYKELDGQFDRILRTAVIPLSEPLKVRTITKAEALPSYLSKSLQKAMKKYINQFPSMVLTTRPLEINDFYEVWKKQKLIEDKYHISFTLHVSGDYKSATDKLNINFTKMIFEKVLERLEVGGPEIDIFRSVLYEQDLYYPPNYTRILAEKLGEQYVDKERKLFHLTQQNGQLMGSILSFPILCLANLICYRTALENYLSKVKGSRVYVSYKDLPVMVNGDDIYFMSNHAFYEDWKDSISTAGFELSIGKNYIHDRVFTINSQCFLQKGDKTVEEIGYLNLGLLMNQSKSGEQCQEKAIWTNYNQLTQKCFSPEITHRNFLYYNRPLVDKITKNGNYNLFLPPMLGGLGFIKPEKVICTLTNFQKELATYLDNQNTDYELPRYINKVSIPFHEPYPGKYSIIKVPYLHVHHTTTLTKLETANKTFTLDIEQPYQLVYRMFGNDLLKAFRKSKKNYTGKLFFDLSLAYRNIYPYKWVYQFTAYNDQYKINNRFRILSNILNKSLEEMFHFWRSQQPFFAQGPSCMAFNTKFRKFLRIPDHDIIEFFLSDEQKKVLTESLVSTM